MEFRKDDAFPFCHIIDYEAKGMEVSLLSIEESDGGVDISYSIP